MYDTLTNWEIPITFIKITQNVVDGDLVTSQEQIGFLGVWQPLRMENLELKPENQRTWSWYWLHVRYGTIDLKPADKVIYKDTRYKVMSKKDYSLNGYTEYELILDYEQTST